MCGLTLHKCFKLPVVENGETVRSRLPPLSHQGIVLTHASCILLDELPTTSVSNYDAIDLMLRELMDNDLPFGGKVVLAIGDFNQMPPVVPKAEPGAVVAETVLAHRTWPATHKFTLHENYRQQKDPRFNRLLRYMTRGPPGIADSTNDAESPTSKVRFRVRGLRRSHGNILA